MSTMKKCKVVMLPTYEASPIDLFRDGNKLIQNPRNIKTLNNQHIYILSDDEIKEGDWYIYCHQISKRTSKNQSYPYPAYKKIIATTDESLCDGKCAKNECVCIFPQPSEGFLDVYVDFYNRGEPITEVMVEYNECSRHEDCIGDFNSLCSKPIPKINSKDNTITVDKVKDSWTREEVKQLFFKLHDHCMNQPTNHNYEDTFVLKKDLDKWLEENL